MERIVAIVDKITNGGYPNCSSLARELEVSPKTIQRDVNFIRDRLHFPLEYDEREYGYFLTEEVRDLKRFDVQVEDLAALFLARQTMGALRGTRVASLMQPSFEKVGKLLEGKVSLSTAEMESVFSARTMGTVKTDLSIFGKIAEAVLGNREIGFSYKGLNAKKSEFRRIQPYHVGEVNGGWYVVGFDLERQAQRTFALQRLTKMKVFKVTFDLPKDVVNGFGGGLGAWSSEKQFSVKLQVSGWVFRVVQERVWHESQEVRVIDEKNEVAEVTMSVSALEDVVSLVLSWGKHVKVISPKKLLELIRQEVKEMEHF